MALSKFEYSECCNGQPEDGFDKIAIFGQPPDQPEHVVWLSIKNDWKWSSKLGALEDVRHNILDGAKGNHQSQVLVFMKRHAKHRDDNSILSRIKFNSFPRASPAPTDSFSGPQSESPR